MKFICLPKFHLQIPSNFVMLLLNRRLSGSIVQKNLETAKIYLILSTSKHGYVQWGRSQFFDFTSSRRIRNFSTSILPSNWERCKSRNSRKFGMLQTACDSIENPLIIFRQFKCVGSFHLKWILVTTSTLTATQEKKDFAFTSMYQVLLS